MRMVQPQKILSCFLLAAFWMQQNNVSAVKVVRGEIQKRFTCEEEPIAPVIPILLADKCTRISSDIAMKYDCNEYKFRVFIDPDCNSPEMEDYDYVECLTGVLDQDQCEEYPANSLVNYQVGQACDNNNRVDAGDNVDFVIGQSAYKLDTCLRFETENAEGSYKLVYSNSDHSMVTFQVFSHSMDCKGEFISDTFTFGECKMSLIGTFGAPNGLHLTKKLAVKLSPVVEDTLPDVSTKKRYLSWLMGLIAVLTLSGGLFLVVWNQKSDKDKDQLRHGLLRDDEA